MNVSQQLPHKTVRAVRQHYTNLTQPTDCGGGLGWSRFYHKPARSCPGGIPSGLSDSVRRRQVRESHQGDDMITNAHSQIIPRSYVVDALARLRQEWQEAANGVSLVEINANVGLLLADVAASIGLSTVEQAQVFGGELAHEIESKLSVKVSRKNGNGRR